MVTRKVSLSKISWIGFFAVCIWILPNVPSVTRAQPVSDLRSYFNGIVKILALSPYGTRRYGSGFIVQKGQNAIRILTAAHMVKGASESRVMFFGYTVPFVRASVEEVEEFGFSNQGLALLKVVDLDRVPSSIQSLPLSLEEDSPAIGDALKILGSSSQFRRFESRGGYLVSYEEGVIEFNPTGSWNQEMLGAPIIWEGKVIGLLQNLFTYAEGNTANSTWNFLKRSGIHQNSEGVGSFNPLVKTKEKHTKYQWRNTTKYLLPKSKLGKDGAPMRLVPGGRFSMGSKKNEGLPHEFPKHGMYVPSFYIDQYEITVERYKRFLTATGRKEPKYWNQIDWERDTQKPVVGVDWFDAQDYCKWVGRRLPLESEWEKAAKGILDRIYPWGGDLARFREGQFWKRPELFQCLSREAGKRWLIRTWEKPIWGI